ncbi:MAG: hypothetical protein JOZ62_15400 [Acidobacteriaceae bacterium]|nr:hypothetical protein [Acidobacteriaceae bacterium]
MDKLVARYGECVGRLHKAIFPLVYDSYMQELISEELLNFWSRIDAVSSVLVALTSSGSTVAGLAFWKTGTGGALWIVFSLTATVLAVVSTVLQIPSRIKTQTDLSVAFRDIELQAERFYEGLDTADLTKAEEVYRSLDHEFREVLRKAPNDLIMTEKWRENIQTRLNAKMKEKGYITHVPDVHKGSTRAN